MSVSQLTVSKNRAIYSPYTLLSNMPSLLFYFILFYFTLSLFSPLFPEFRVSEDYVNIGINKAMYKRILVFLDINLDLKKFIGR